MQMSEAAKYSEESLTAIEMIESLAAEQRRKVIEKLREIVAEETAEAKWDQLFRDNPEPLREMARKARAAHAAGKTKPMQF